ncbi:MAG: FHA domain-containing protein [Anaerolineae bacterium]|nr:FHA domain-containing protein [Anaerolineae bacterium]
MSVEVWYGSKPRHAAEQETVVALYHYLQLQEEHFVVLLNFFAGQSNEIDLVILKQNGVFLAELKHVWTPIFGAREGDWCAKQVDGSEIILNPDRPNPFKQAQRNYYSWRDWCQENSAVLQAEANPSQFTDWTRVMTHIVFYPDLPQGSQIKIGEFPVRALGLPQFLTALTVRSSTKVCLSRPQMQQFPQLFGLQHWYIAQPTERLAAWHPQPFAALASRGHNFSVPFLRLDDETKVTYIVGRDPESDLVIANNAVSRRHARLYRQQGRWIVQDLGSTSGTFVSYNGDPQVESRVVEREFALKNNSIVRFGPAAYTLLLYENCKGEPA